MAIVNGWVDWAVRISGPAWKVYAEPNTGDGIVCHSAEGTRASTEASLLNPDRDASWMFFVAYDGTLIQYYPVTASTWTSGNKKANTSTWNTELEGFAGQAANELQTLCLLHLYDEWMLLKDKQLTRAGTVLDTKTLWEHKEVWDWGTPNAGPTACPSNRYDAVYPRIRDLDEVKAAYETPPETPQFEAELAELGNKVSTLGEEIEALSASLQSVTATLDAAAILDQTLINRIDTLNKAVMARLSLLSVCAMDYPTIKKAHKLLSDQGIIEPITF